MKGQLSVNVKSSKCLNDNKLEELFLLCSCLSLQYGGDAALHFKKYALCFYTPFLQHKWTHYLLKLSIVHFYWLAFKSLLKLFKFSEFPIRYFNNFVLN